MLFGLNVRLGIRSAVWLGLCLTSDLKKINSNRVYDFVAVLTSDDCAADAVLSVFAPCAQV